MPNNHRTWITVTARPRTVRRILAATAVGAILAGTGIGAGIARADRIGAAADIYGPAICDVFDETPHTGMVYALAEAFMREGYTDYESGRVLAEAVLWYCPRHVPLLNAFAAQWGGDW